jgi:hypothetical protein
MLPLLHLIKFTGSRLKRTSHSLLIDTHQVYLRNVFLFCFGLSVARQFFGDNIVCHSDTYKISNQYVESYCFINGTMTMNDGEIFYHDYYQWVSILLLLFAVTFYFPFRIWSRKFGFFLDQLASKEVEDCDKVYRLIHESDGNSMFFKTMGLEWYYAVHVAVHVRLVDWFFNRAWSTNDWKWTTVRTIFPDTGKCFLDYYSGGDVTHGKFICLLPLSTVYRKVFIALYGVTIAIIGLHCIFFAYRLFLIYKHGFRKINRVWCTTVARQLAPHWQTKKYFDNPKKHFDETAV